MQVCLVTPTYGLDLERFKIQRASVESFADESITHVAVVPPEEYGLFRSAVNLDSRFTILTTDSLLPAHLEHQRRYGETRKRRFLKRRRDRKKSVPSGWWLQQAIKLAAPEATNCENIVFLDSDAFLKAPLTASRFFDEQGRLHFYRGGWLDAETASWNIDALDFFEYERQGTPVERYIHCPMVARRAYLLEIREYCRSRMTEKDCSWIDVLWRYRIQSEYTLYGVYCEFVSPKSDIVAVEPEVCTQFWWPSDFSDFDRRFKDAIADVSRPFCLVQSNVGYSVERLKSLVARHLPEVRLP